MLKNVGDSIVYAFDLWESGKIEWGKVAALGIVEGGVGVADNEYYRSVVPKDVLDIMDATQAKGCKRQRLRLNLISILRTTMNLQPGETNNPLKTE